mmetsp:Transcript_23480/g.41286  ORF Transcript_23480/g.41286 Transcript_23480/m.41286 type:complete len:193 (-) Transcript_23480:204-782(-)
MGNCVRPDADAAIAVRPDVQPKAAHLQQQTTSISCAVQSKAMDLQKAMHGNDAQQDAHDREAESCSSLSSASTSTPQFEESGSESLQEVEFDEEEGARRNFPISSYPSTGACLKSAVKSFGETSQQNISQRHISFESSRENTVHCSEYSIMPYGEVYGIHPGYFVFDRAGNKIIGFDTDGEPVIHRDGVVLV